MVESRGKVEVTVKRWRRTRTENAGSSGGNGGSGDDGGRSIVNVEKAKGGQKSW